MEIRRLNRRMILSLRERWMNWSIRMVTLSVLLRVYLLFGLILHKFTWEILKNRRTIAANKGGQQQSTRVRLVKLAKLAILLGILLQTVTPTVLPILAQPFMLRVVGFIVYTLGLVTAISARLELGNNWLDIEQARVMARHDVVATGIYRFIRHPIYVGDLLLLSGLELALNSWLVLGVAILTPLVLTLAIREERMLVQSLPGYEAYCKKTKRFVPLLI